MPKIPSRILHGNGRHHELGIFPICCTIMPVFVVIKPSVSVVYLKETGFGFPPSSLFLMETKSVRYFPHEIADLSIALDFILLPNGLAQEVANQWALRYAILIWLSLICMIPFDLAQFDEVETPGKTASSLELVAKQFLGKAGLEREAASLLLSRLYIRYYSILFQIRRLCEIVWVPLTLFSRADGKALFQEFLTWSSELIQSTAVDPFLVGIMFPTPLDNPLSLWDIKAGVYRRNVLRWENTPTFYLCSFSS